jgi:hypothetical protein
LGGGVLGAFNFEPLLLEEYPSQSPQLINKASEVRNLQVARLSTTLLLFSIRCVRNTAAATYAVRRSRMDKGARFAIYLV